MNRCSFVQSVAGAGLLSQPAVAQPSAARTGLYCLDYFYYRQGDQAGRLLQFLSSQVPLWTKHSRAFGVLLSYGTARADAPCSLRVFSSPEQMVAAENRMEADSALQKARQELERGTEPAFDSRQRVLLRTADFSPEIVPLAEKPQRPRYFEIRVYHSPTERQLRMVHERFAGPRSGFFTGPAFTRSCTATPLPARTCRTSLTSSHSTPSRTAKERGTHSAPILSGSRCERNRSPVEDRSWTIRTFRSGERHRSPRFSSASICN